MVAGNGRNGASSADHDPLPESSIAAIQLAVARLEHGARELTAIAWIAPVFLAGLELAIAGFVAGGKADRSAAQRPLDLALFIAYGAALAVLAVRARRGSSRTRRLLPELLSADPEARDLARAHVLRLAGPPFARRLAAWVGGHGCALFLGLVAIAFVASNLLPLPDPVWLAVFVSTAVAIDLRWRAMVTAAAATVPAKAYP